MTKAYLVWEVDGTSSGAHPRIVAVALRREDADQCATQTQGYYERWVSETDVYVRPEPA